MENLNTYKIWNCRKCKTNNWSKLIIQPNKNETIFQCVECHNVLNFRQPIPVEIEEEKLLA